MDVDPMTTMTRAQHALFCDKEGWDKSETRTYTTYTLQLHDGRVLRTRIISPADDTAYPEAMAARILSHQLDVAAEDFFSLVDDGNLPPRPQPTLGGAQPDSSISLALVRRLRLEHTLSDEEIIVLTDEEAHTILG